MNTNISEKIISLTNNIFTIKSNNDESEKEENMHFFRQNSDNILTSTNSDKNLNENNSLSSIDLQKEKNKKISSDVDFIKMLLGDKSNEDSTSTEKNQIDIFLNQIIVNDEIKLNYFPIIEEINLNDYMIPIPEKILDKGEFFTAIREKIETNKYNYISKNFEIENINLFFNGLSNKNYSYDNILKEIYDDLECGNKNKILLRKIVKSIYEKCRNIICDIKRNIKNLQHLQQVKKKRYLVLESLILLIYK